MSSFYGGGAAAAGGGDSGSIGLGTAVITIQYGNDSPSTQVVLNNLTLFEDTSRFPEGFYESALATVKIRATDPNSGSVVETNMVSNLISQHSLIGNTTDGCEALIMDFTIVIPQDGETPVSIITSKTICARFYQNGVCSDWQISSIDNNG